MRQMKKFATVLMCAALTMPAAIPMQVQASEATKADVKIETKATETLSLKLKGENTPTFKYGVAKDLELTLTNNGEEEIKDITVTPRVKAGMKNWPFEIEKVSYEKKVESLPGKESVDIMIRGSRDVIDDLIRYGVEFDKKDGELAYTKEGAHSKPRILFHKDITGREITSKLLARVQELDNVEILEYTTMTDIIEEGGVCRGVVMQEQDGTSRAVRSAYTIVASGGIGGLYRHSTNFPHLTGDALEVAKKHHIRLEHLDYVQIHPTTLYSEKPGRRFLISESVRGEGALLYNKNMERFVDELLPRDVVTRAIREQMEKDGTNFVWLSMAPIEKETILSHFPNIYEHCLEEGYDVTKECIPVVPAQHYFMGGIWVDKNSHTSMPQLFAVGETSCNGVHGANRLASNSLLESLVFAKRAANLIKEQWCLEKEQAV